MEKIINFILSLHENSVVRHITHYDLDGNGPIILMKILQKIIGFDYKYIIQPKVADDGIQELDDETTHILVTDLSFYDDTSKTTILECIRDGIKVLNIDHHQNVDNGEEYKYVDTTRCASLIMFEALQHILVDCFDIEIDRVGRMRVFYKLVNNWDTFEWKKEIEQVKKYSIGLNTYFGFKKPSEFISEMVDYLYYENPSIEQFRSMLLGYYEINKTMVEKSASKFINTAKELETEHGIVRCAIFNDSATSLSIALDRVFEIDVKDGLKPYIYIALMPGINTVSMRTILDDVDVSVIARKYGGNGHPKAAGFPLPDALKKVPYGEIEEKLIKYVID